MTRWKKDAKEFEAAVSFEEKRGYQSYIPKPIMALLGNPRYLKYTVKGRRIELTPGEPKESTAVNTENEQPSS